VDLIEVDVSELRPAETLVVAFAGVKGGLGGIPREFHRTLSASPCAALFVVDHARRWYQYDLDEMAALTARISAAAAEVGASRIVTLGNSMGGFGALLVGALVGADRILAFSPQTCIEPAATRSLGDDRWVDHQCRIDAYPFGDLNRIASPRGHVVLCFGADDALDVAHAARLHWPCEQFPIAGAGHAAAGALKERGELAAFVAGRLVA
jgi:predicted esterase YcpF (UPF0227 family)